MSDGENKESVNIVDGKTLGKQLLGTMKSC
jgi:hypothetical protein